MLGDPVFVPAFGGNPAYYWQNSISVFYIFNALSMGNTANSTSIQATFQQIETTPGQQCAVTALFLEFSGVPSTDIVTAVAKNKGYSDTTSTGNSINTPTKTDLLLIAGSDDGQGEENAGANYYAFYDAPGIPMVLGGIL
jgi:hypothetical protein